MYGYGTSPVSAFSHGVAALAFGLLAIRLWPQMRVMAAAALITAVWAACVLTGAMVDVAEALRTCSWLALLLSAAGPRLLACVVLLPAAGLAVTLWPATPVLLQAVLPLASSVIGMLLVEHVYRNAPQNSRWGIKYACLGIGALFCYDFYLYSDAMLLRRVDPDIWAARGIVNGLSAPMLAIAMSRGPTWTPAIQLSRHIMFHSVALLGAAAYLMAMAFAAWYLRYVGGAWGALMQLACLCGSGLLLAALLFSGSMRARLKLLIAKHLYQARYLTHQAVRLGYHPDVILAGRRINDNMAKFVAEKTVKEMVRAGFKLKGSHVNVLGLTFKENCPDLRNSKVADLIRELESYGLQVHVHDPVADADEAFHEYGVRLQSWDDLPTADALISAVAHRELSSRPLPQLLKKVGTNGCFIDLKSQFDPVALRESGLSVWRL